MNRMLELYFVVTWWPLTTRLTLVDRKNRGLLCGHSGAWLWYSVAKRSARIFGFAGWVSWSWASTWSWWAFTQANFGVSGVWAHSHYTISKFRLTSARDNWKDDTTLYNDCRQQRPLVLSTHIVTSMAAVGNTHSGAEESATSHPNAPNKLASLPSALLSNLLDSLRVCWNLWRHCFRGK